jgi:hypothetical protein
MKVKVEFVVDTEDYGEPEFMGEGERYEGIHTQ